MADKVTMQIGGMTCVPVSYTHLTGCLAQRYQDELVAELPECDGVLGLGANADIVEAVRKVMEGEKTVRFPGRCV